MKDLPQQMIVAAADEGVEITDDRPLYAAQDGDRRIVGSSPGNLARELADRPVDAGVIARRLGDWRRDPEETIFAGVRRLPADPQVDVDGSSPHHYPNNQDAATRLRRILEEQAAALINNHTAIHVGLSGGVDSSSLVAAFVDQGHRPVVWLLDDGSRSEAERHHARSIIDRFGLTAHVVAVDPASFPDYFQATVERSGGEIINARAVAKLLFYRDVATAEPPVFVTGVGADDIFAGKPDRWTLDTHGTPGFATSSKATRALGRRLLGRNFQVRESELAPSTDLQELLKLHMASVTQPLVLPMEMHLPAAMGIPVAAPFLSPAMMAFAKTLRREELINSGRGKHVLRRAVEPLVGRDVAWQPKTPVYAPVGGGEEAIRRKWADLFAALLSPDRLKALESVQVQPVEQLIDDYRTLPLSSKSIVAMEQVLMHLASLTILNGQKTKRR